VSLRKLIKLYSIGVEKVTEVGLTRWLYLIAYIIFTNNKHLLGTYRVQYMLQLLLLLFLCFRADVYS